MPAAFLFQFIDHAQNIAMTGIGIEQDGALVIIMIDFIITQAVLYSGPLRKLVCRRLRSECNKAFFLSISATTAGRTRTGVL